MNRRVTWKRVGKGEYSSPLGMIRREGRGWTWFPSKAAGSLCRSGYRTLADAKHDAELESDWRAFRGREP